MADSCFIRVMSYNCRGFNACKADYIKSLLSETDILFLQEHWLSDGQLCLLGGIDSKFIYLGVSGFDNSEILSGRPYGGCAILWRSSLLASFEILSTNSKRICALRMTSDTLKLLFVNVYMPYEGDETTTLVFADQLSEVENIINNNNDCHIIVGGDFNVDFSRNRLHTAMLDSFCESMGLNPVVRHSKSSVDYSYNFGQTRFNVLDHFLLSGTLFSKSVEQAYVIHDPDNMSDHDPIAIKLLLMLHDLGFHKRIHKPRVSWVKATEVDLHNYRSVLADRLRSLRVPVDALLCTNLQCNDLAHINCVNEYSLNLTNACIEAAEAVA